MIIQKRIIISLCIAVVFFYAPLYSFAQRSSFSPVETGLSVVGPDTAFDFYEGFTGPRVRGKYPEGQSIPLEDLTNITLLSKHLYHPKDVLKNFEKTKTDDQVCALVMVKTEACRQGDRLCAVTTAALEKMSTPILARFKIYGFQVSPDSKGVIRGTPLERDIKRLYEFKQGPGARLVVLCNGMMMGTGARDVGLSDDEFRKNNGRTPKLERFLEDALSQLSPQAPSSPLSPQPSVSGEHHEPANAAEADRLIRKLKERKKKGNNASAPNEPRGNGAMTEEDFKKASVKLVVGGANGSATIIGCDPVLNRDGMRNCLLVTAGHPYAKDSSPLRVNYELAPHEGYIEFPSGVKKRVSLIGGDLRKDFALVGFTVNADEAISTVSLAPREFRVAANNKVIQAGYPHGGKQAIRYRTVKAIDFFRDSKNIVCHNITSPGDSGGGLLELKHGLVGICSASDPTGHQTLFVDTQEIYDFVDRNPRIRSWYDFIFSR